MNEFNKLNGLEQKTGNVVENMKDIECLLDNIILDYINSKELGFTRDIILNSSILPIRGKIKIIKTICHNLNEKIDFTNLHKLVNIRNIFAHGKPFVEGEDMLFKLSGIKNDEKLQEYEFDGLHKKFIDLFNQQTQMLIQLQSKIKSRDYLCRLFYIDTIFNQYTNSKEFKSDDIENKLKNLEEESKLLDIKEIEKRINEVNNKNLFWFNRFKNKVFSYMDVSILSLIIEKDHDNLDGISGSSGKKIKDFFDINNNNEEVKKRVNFIVKHFDVITKYIRVVVRKVNENYEIMSGNHRVMAFIEKGLKEIPVITIDEIK